MINSSQPNVPFLLKTAEVITGHWQMV